MLIYFRAVESVSHTVNGAQGIVDANLIKKLVEKLKTETDEIKVKSDSKCLYMNLKPS